MQPAYRQADKQDSTLAQHSSRSIRANSSLDSFVPIRVNPWPNLLRATKDSSYSIPEFISAIREIRGQTFFAQRRIRLIQSLNLLVPFVKFVAKPSSRNEGFVLLNPRIYKCHS